jgi:hypothetical protein
MSDAVFSIHFQGTVRSSQEESEKTQLVSTTEDVKHDIRDIIRTTGILRCVRRVVYFLVLAVFIYSASWSTVLCRITRAVLQFPGRIKSVVWVATLGMFLFYATFVLAQCHSISFRIRRAIASQYFKEDPQYTGIVHDFLGQSENTRDFTYLKWLDVFSVPSWRVLAILAGGLVIDLVGASLYSIPSIRSFLGMETPPNVSEPWATMVFLISIWFVIVLYVWCNSTRESDVDANIDGPGTVYVVVALALYAFVGFVTFFSWGFIVMANLKHTEDMGWMIAFVVLSIFTGIIMIDTGKKRMMRKDARFSEEGEEAKNSALNTLVNAHRAAAWFQAFLIALTLTMGASNGDFNWFHEYILRTENLFFYAPDWQHLVASEKTTDIVKIEMCASANPSKMYPILLSLCWSSCSLIQHLYSVERLQRETRGIPSNTKKRSIHSFYVYVVVLIVWLIVSRRFLLLLTVGFGVAVLLKVVKFLTVDAVWDLLGPLRYSPGVESNQAAHQAILTVSAYKWIEYTFSAALMHIVVCSLGAVNSVHELALCVTCLSISMLFVNISECELRNMECHAENTRSHSRISLRERVNLELPFIFLSFFAKGILTLALILPIVVPSEISFEITPFICSPILV